MRLTGRAWLFSVLIAWSAAYAAYFALTLLVDTFHGGQQWWSQWQFESRSALFAQGVEVVVASAWLVLPAVLVATVLVLGRWGSPAWRPALLRSGLSAAALGGVVAAIGVAPVTATVLAAALWCATLAARLFAGWAVARGLGDLNA